MCSVLWFLFLRILCVLDFVFLVFCCVFLCFYLCLVLACTLSFKLALNWPPVHFEVRHSIIKLGKSQSCIFFYFDPRFPFINPGYVIGTRYYPPEQKHPPPDFTLKMHKTCYPTTEDPYILKFLSKLATEGPKRLFGIPFIHSYIHFRRFEKDYLLFISFWNCKHFSLFWITLSDFFILTPGIFGIWRKSFLPQKGPIGTKHLPFSLILLWKNTIFERGKEQMGCAFCKWSQFASVFLPRQPLLTTTFYTGFHL